MMSTRDRKGKGKAVEQEQKSTAGGSKAASIVKKTASRMRTATSSGAVPVAAADYSRNRISSPQASGSSSGYSDEEGDDDVQMDEEMNEEEVKEEAAPHYAQFMGDSDLDEDGDSLSDEDDQDEEGGISSRKQREGSDASDLDDVQADLQQIPLETLMKAQRKLNKQARQSTSKADAFQLEESAEEGAGNGRRGRTEARRGVVADKVVPRKAKESAKPKVRDNKHAPTEMSSKRAVGRFRQIVDIEKTNRRDPRFDALSGELDESRFRTSYSFIDEARSEEIKRLRYAISQARKRKGAVDMDELDAMAAELQRLQSKQAEHERRQRQATVVSGWKNEERQKRETGKAAFFLKKGETKKIVETKRMEEVSQDKRRLRKVLKRKDQAEKKKSISSAPPRRQV